MPQGVRCVVDLDGCDVLLIEIHVAHEDDNGEIWMAHEGACGCFDGSISRVGRQ